MKRKPEGKYFLVIGGLAMASVLFLSSVACAFFVEVTNDLSGPDAPSLQVIISHALSTEWHDVNNGKPLDPGKTTRFSASGLEIGHCWGDIAIKASKELKGCEAGILSKNYTYRRIDMCGNVKVRIDRAGCGFMFKIE